MIQTPIVDDVRKHVDSSLDDAALSDVIEACVAQVNARAPTVDAARGKLAVIQLVNIELLVDGVSDVRDGDWQQTRAFSARERESVLRSLTRGRPPRLVTDNG